MVDLRIRQFIPLALLYEAEDQSIEGRTRLQKLAFLTREELVDEDIDVHEFIEYDYGPFSKELLDDLEELESQGLVNIQRNPTFGGNTRYDYQIEDDGIEIFEAAEDAIDDISTIHQAAKKTIDEYNSMSLRRLLNYVYEEFPRFQEESAYY